MSNNLKPWFREDIARAMMSIYFSSLISRPRQQMNDEYRTGFAAALSSVAIVIGINPESILQSDDIQLLREVSSRQ
jgi:hypothetical protein